ncbi:hypothetical protein GCM10026982_01220 [Nocardiopsis aegyptia]
MPGKIGHTSPQPMVMQTSEASTASGVRIFGFWSVMSMPTSSMAATTAGLTESAGAEPAERTSTRSPARCRSQAAAIWERPALWTQTNSTEGRSVMGVPPSSRVRHRGSPGPAEDVYQSRMI